MQPGFYIRVLTTLISLSVLLSPAARAEHRSRGLASAPAVDRPSAPRAPGMIPVARSEAAPSVAVEPSQPRAVVAVALPQAVTLSEMYFAGADSKFSALAAVVGAPAAKPVAKTPDGLATPAPAKAPALASIFLNGSPGGSAGGSGAEQSGGADGSSDKSGGGKDGKSPFNLGDTSMKPQETGVTCWAAVARDAIAKLLGRDVPETQVVSEGTGDSSAKPGDPETMKKALTANGLQVQVYSGAEAERERASADLSSAYYAQLGESHVTRQIAKGGGKEADPGDGAVHDHDRLLDYLLKITM